MRAIFGAKGDLDVLADPLDTSRMPTPTTAPSRPVLLLAPLALAVTLAVSRSAQAHFILQAPACYSEQDSFGAPLKSAPCGQSDPNDPIVLTGAVTTYGQGQMLTVTIDETVFHPGHYRVAIAPDMSMLPDDPPVTAGSTPCGTTVIDSAPTLPILADDVFDHTAAFSGPQTTQIALPSGFTCTGCVLQVIEFMSDHSLNPTGGCFYHHCATVTVTGPPDAGSPDAGGVDAGMDASNDVSVSDAAHAMEAGRGTDAADESTSAGAHGCGCRTPNGSTRAWPLAAIVALAAASMRRRRRPRA